MGNARTAAHGGSTVEGGGRRLGRWTAVAAMVATPLITYALAVVTWQQAEALATDLAGAPSAALATTRLGEVLAVGAGAVGTAVAAHLSLMSVLLLVTPRRSRVRTAVVRLTPLAWRRLVAAAAAGALSAGLAIPASAMPSDSDAGWVPEPLTPAAAAAPPRDPIWAPPRDSAMAPAAVARSAPPVDVGAIGDAPGTGAQPAPAPPDAPGDRTHTVVRGDSLWSITADALDGELDGASVRDATQIALAWPELYEANRGTVGGDPSLIHPGQRLVIPEEWAR
ncbi:MAG: LysM peptidoglycan-binding domain-containing protein [Demequina sp.]